VILKVFTRADGKPNEVANNRQVIDAYLGEDHTIAV
jgi:ABC-type branched-subunit amino acid transport system ATPase component